MNKLFTKLLFACALLFYTASDVLYAQCTTSIHANRDTIACGESLFLTNSPPLSTTSDDFTGSGGVFGPLWDPAQTTFTANFNNPGNCFQPPGSCGPTHPTPYFWYASGGVGTLTSVPLDVNCGGIVNFLFRHETQGSSGSPCDGPDQPNEGIYFQYKNGAGAWTTIHYFLPYQAGGLFAYQCWNTYSYIIPAGAIGTNTRFRWTTMVNSYAAYDQWGLDDINIISTAPCGNPYITSWFGPNIPNPYNLDTITVTPDSTPSIYSVSVTDGTNTCTDSFTVYSEQPTITATQFPSGCTGSTQLDALASIPANCNYRIDLYDAGGDGWTAGGNPPQYHNMDVMINGIVYSNFTMGTGSGPDVHQIAVTDGDMLETYLQNWGSNYADCGYAIYDSQGNMIRADGMPPIPGGTPPVGCNVLSSSLPEVYVTCPTTLFYSYSWQTTAGTVIGLSNPNIYNPSVTVSDTTYYVVTGYDPLHPWCIATDTVEVLPNNSNITATLSGSSSPICNGDAFTLSFLPMVGLTNWSLTLNINGTPQPVYTLDGSGNDISTGLPLTFYPTSTTTYDVVTLLDATNCPAAVTNPSLTVTVNQIPNAGMSASITVCAEISPFFDLYSILTGSPDLGGTWTNSAGAVQPSSFYIPLTSSSDVFTYTVTVSPCPTASSTVTVTNNTEPDAGQNAPRIVCENDAAFNMINFLGGTPQSGGSWTNSGGSGVSNMFDPPTMSSGVFTYTVPGLWPCPSNSADLTVTVNPLPTALISTTTPAICTGNNATIDFTFTGTAPFDVTYNDGISNITQTIINTTGSIVISPTITTTYTLVNVSDANLCTQTVSGSSITVTVNALPTVTASSTPLSPLCDGDDLTLNGGGATSYVWDNGVTDNTLFTPGVGTVLYTVTGTDVNSCENIATISVVVNALPTALISTTTPAICTGNNATIDFTFTGTAPFDVTYNDGTSNFTQIINNTTGSIVISPGPVVTTTYTLVNVSDANLCTQTVSGSITVTVNPLPTVIISGTTTITQGMSTPIDFTFTGSAPFTVIYDDGTGPITSPSFNSTTGTVPVTPNATTTYTLVSVTDNNGCTSTVIGAITITVNQLPTVTLLGTTSICVGQNSDLDFNLGGIPNFTVEYNIIDINNPSGVLNSSVFNSTGSNLLNVSPIITTTYILVSITDGNGVIVNNSSSVTITVNPLPTAVLSGDFTICDGGQTPLNFALTGAADYSLTYNPGGIIVTLDANGNDSTGTPIMVNPSATTLYSIVSVTDANNCTNAGSGTPTITVDPLPTISISGNTPICFGQSSNLSFTLSGTAPYYVNYLAGGNPANVLLDGVGTINGTPLSVTPNDTTTYTLVDVTDANNCTATANGNITIVVHPLPTVTMSGSTYICDGQSTDLDFNFTGTGPYNINYNIKIGAVSTPDSAVLNNNVDAIAVSPSPTATYTLIDVSDAYCSNTAMGTVIVTVHPLPSASISGGGVICADSTAQIDIIISTSSNAKPFNVIYSNSNELNNTPLAINGNYWSDPNITDDGTYTLSSITDANGCSGNVSGVAIVVVNLLPEALFSSIPQPVDISNPTISFTDLASGHVAGIYDFGDGTTDSTILGGKLSHTYLDTGSYQVTLTVTSIDGCVDDISHTIIIDPAFLIYIPTVFTPNRDGKNDIFIPIIRYLVDEYSFYIYDRFGGFIFETEDQLQGWNGRIHGNEFALAGHYAYAIKIVDLLGKKRTFAGTVTLIR